jgi:hypothetical protein
MKPLYKLLALFVFSAFILSACQKEGSGEAGGDCNNTVMRLKKWQATFDDSDYVEATWNGDGTINTLKLNVPLSEYRTAKFVYAGGRVKETILYYNSSGDVVDTVVYRYNNDGKVDSMYMKNDDGFSRKLTWTNGKLTKLTRYNNGPGNILYYFDIVTDANGNITKADEYWEDGASFKKISTFTYTRDTKKNPFTDLAPYMMFLNDEYEIFWFWGPNNMTDQRYQDFDGTGIDMISGYKFKYNGNCYPNSAQNTIMGQPVFQDDDFIFTYY